MDKSLNEAYVLVDKSINDLKAVKKHIDHLEYKMNFILPKGNYKHDMKMLRDHFSNLDEQLIDAKKILDLKRYHVSD